MLAMINDLWLFKFRCYCVLASSSSCTMLPAQRAERVVPSSRFASPGIQELRG